MTTRSKASAKQSGKLISSPPPSKRGRKRATSAVDTGANAKKKKKAEAAENSEEEQESSEEEQEEKKSRKNARKKSRDAKKSKKSKKSTIASTEPVHLTRAEQALVDQNISIAPPMRPRVTATVTTVASVTAASAPPVSVRPPVSARQRRLEARTERAAAAFEDTNDVKADISNSDSSSSDDDTKSAATVTSGDSTPIDQRLESRGTSLVNEDMAEVNTPLQSACAQSCAPSDDSSVADTESGTLPATVTPGDSTPSDQRSDSHGTSLTNEDMAKVNTSLTVSTGDGELGSTITPSTTSAPVTPPMIGTSVIVTEPAPVTNDVHMRSPPLSPSRDLQGASRTTGGIFRGRAHGNVFNHADVDDFIESDVIPTKGEVHLYTSHGDPQQTDPSKVKATMFVKHEMSSLTLGPVLNKLGSRFSPIKKSNSRIFTWEEDMWNIKGRFEDAIQDDDDVSWVKENNKYIIRILA
ncbi:hypothetical protein DXG01_011149, partial [Tephrocybe rancida]